MYRVRDGELQVLLVHPGGPYFKGKDLGAWSIPKGEVEAGEELLAAAKREFEEELGFAPVGTYTPLTPVTQKGGKIVHAWAIAGDCEPTAEKCNFFQMQFPPKSGKWISVRGDRSGGVFRFADGAKKDQRGPGAFIDELVASVAA